MFNISEIFQVNSSKAVLNNEMSLNYRLTNADPSMKARTTVHRVPVTIVGPSNQVYFYSREQILEM